MYNIGGGSVCRQEGALLTQPMRTELSVHRERAFLVGVGLDGSRAPGGASLAELEQLADSAGAVVVGKAFQRRKRPDARYYMGSGKIGEVALEAAAADAEVVIFDNDLSPAQVRNLEKALKLKVVDRSELILDIFATHARTRQAKLQVELAQLEYMFPRLVRMWTHLENIEGGSATVGIGTRGPGEQQLEVDRRLVRKRIRDLRRGVKAIEARKAREVASRSTTFTASLVGYTNAGKSTLMNALTGAGVHVADKLFATLDTRTREWFVDGGRKVLLSDTVGFIRDLPHHLVTSFMATLEEAKRADLLIHVADAVHPEVFEQIEAVSAVLGEIGASQTPTVLVLNKIDLGVDPTRLLLMRKRYPASVEVSALRKDGLDQLARVVEAAMELGSARVDVTLPAGDGEARSWLRRISVVDSEEFQDDSIVMGLRVSTSELARFSKRFPDAAISYVKDDGQNSRYD